MLVLCYCVGNHWVAASTNSLGDCCCLYLEEESCDEFHGFVYKPCRYSLEGFECAVSRVALVIAIRAYH